LFDQERLPLLLRTCRLLIAFGTVLAVTGAVGLLLGFAGLIDLDLFAFGISAGARILGTLAITGCLLGALGCFWLEFNNES
jgi:hypothetical protein